MNSQLRKLTILTWFAATITIAQIGVHAQPAEDVVLQWNRVLRQTLAVPGLQPATVMGSRSYSMMHLAMFDAVNSIEGTYTPYLTDVPGTRHASKNTAAAKAAYDVLRALYPSRQSVFDAELAISIGGDPSNRDRQAMRIGELTAEAILAARVNDNWSATPPPFSLPPTTGNWQPTPPATSTTAFTHYGNVTPFGTTSSRQFAPNPPPALNSEQYAADLNEAKLLGKSDSAARTAEQTSIALRWASPAQGGATWTTLLQQLAASRNDSLIENARLYALFWTVSHDALQTSFTSKYDGGLWRPITAIRRADEDGNPGTDPDPTWNSLIPSPPYPTYAGNAATDGMSRATILGLFFGRDDIPFSVAYPGPPAISRSYPGFNALANEQARSRIYAGIHFEFDSTAGQAIGRNVANHVFQNYLRPRCSGN